MASQMRLQKTAARLLSRDAGLLINASEASSTGSGVVAAARCRNYASTSRGSDASSIAQRNANESPILVPHGSSSSITFTPSLRALSTSATSSMHASSQSQSQSTASTSSSSGAVTGSATLAKPSPTTRGILGGIAKVMGYDTTTSAAIRTTSDYYDRCSERDEKEGSFWYDECGLPESYQTWMQITNLHIWLLSVRFRSLPAPLGKAYIQEIVNHYFIHSESLMRGRYHIKQNRLIKGYMRDMLYQYHGANMGYDEGLISGSDAVLAAAVWRNLFGAGWGRMGGVKGKLNQDGKEIKEEQHLPTTSQEAIKDTDTVAGAVAESLADLDPTVQKAPPGSPSPSASTASAVAVPGQKVGNQAGGYHSGGSGLVERLPTIEPDTLVGIEAKEARFAVNLERLVKWIRSEVRRMENVSDESVMHGAGINRTTGESMPGSLTYFSRI